ncbi:MAG: hypothetical protein V4489_09230 [Chlamydiota bacterium]
MRKHSWESIIELIEACRHGISFSQLLDENFDLNKKVLQRRLRDLTLKNRIIKLGKGKTVRYFAVSQEKSFHFLKIPLDGYKEEIRKHVVCPVSFEKKWDFLNKYIIMSEPLSIRACAKAIFSHNFERSSKNLRGSEKNDNQFSVMKRLSKEKSDMESHRILNPKINFIVLNI